MKEHLLKQAQKTLVVSAVAPVSPDTPSDKQAASYLTALTAAHLAAPLMIQVFQ